MSKQTIAVDFDGVIHTYEKFHPQITGDVMPGAFETILKLMHMDYQIVVFTARPADQVNEWLQEKWPYKLFPCPVAQNTKPAAIAYIDDRAVLFTNWDDMFKKFMR